MSIGIYKITNPNGKVYIGQSVDLNRRINEHLKYSSSKQPTLYRSICKYGSENHTVDIVEYVNETENINDILNSLEIKYIEQYDCIAPKGLNLKSGGNHWEFSDEAKLKMRNAKLGTVLSDETKHKLSLCNKGQIRSKKVRKNISSGKMGISLTEEHKRNISISKSDKKKEVVQCSLGGEYITSFESIKLATKITGVSGRAISKVCRGIKYYYSAGGFIWKFKNKELCKIAD